MNLYMWEAQVGTAPYLPTNIRIYLRLWIRIQFRLTLTRCLWETNSRQVYVTWLHLIDDD